MKIKFFILALALSSTFAVSVHAQALNDHQIAEIMEEANDAEIAAAKLAEDDAKTAEVKQFAKHMIEQHKMNNKDMKKVVKKNDIDPEKTAMSKAIEEDAKNKKSLLKKQKDLAFDRLYMEQQISMHTQLLNDLDQKFIPAAQKPEFKAHLQATREHVSKHLEEAKAVQAKL
jgi:putative membrane protein